MAYRQLTEPNPVDLAGRLTAIEAQLTSSEVASLVGTHFYAAGNCPAALTTGTDTFGVANTVWLCELQITKNTLITGLSYLIGSVGGTDKVIVMLFDANGNLLANSAVAGATVGTLATFQRVALLTPYQAAPGLYFVGVQTNGTTAKIRTQAAGDHNAGTDTSQTFGTPVKTTPPTSFTAATAPYVMTY